jgi:hypothetical protein
VKLITRIRESRGGGGNLNEGKMNKRNTDGGGEREIYKGKIEVKRGGEVA